MAHNIYQEKFYSYRQAAWHGLGIVSDQKMTAIETAELIDIPDVTTQPIFTIGDDGSTSRVDGQKAIMINGVAHTVVSEKYHEISHKQFLGIWDQCTNAHIETMGVLGNGSTLFVTTELPGFDIKGVEHKCYIMAVNPVTGSDAITIRVTVVRVVCSNTLAASGNNFVSQMHCVHTKSQADQMVPWLTETWKKYEFMAQAICEAYEILASTNVTDEQASKVFLQTYPSPSIPEFDGGEEKAKVDVILDEWSREDGRQKDHRESAMSIFSGGGVGSNLSDTRGTAYGVYNSVAEYEQYARPQKKISSFMFGAGSNRVSKAYDGAMALVK